MIEREELLKIRREFPILERKVAGNAMIYLDNTATSQTPQGVVDEIVRIYTHEKANVHRGVHTLSQEMTDLQEHTREKVRRYINATGIEEIVFTRGTTEGINLVASSFGRRFKAKRRDNPYGHGASCQYSAMAIVARQDRNCNPGRRY